MKSFYIITFGCQMNEHDSERMAGMLKESGYRVSDSPEHADMVILNTCSIREKAEQKFYSELGRLAKFRKPDGRPPKIAVAGCIAQQEGDKILSRAPVVDIVVGPSDIARLPDIVNLIEKRSAPIIQTGGDPEYHQKTVPAVRADRIKAWVSIMYGCDNFCTYCVVPYLRGRERSRQPEDIVKEIRGLAASGYKEVTLLGQNVNSYGKGLDRSCSFSQLLHQVHEIDGIERIRFVTSHPRDLSYELIAALRDLPKICEAIHLPVQSGADRILAAMNRKYTVKEYLDKVKRLRDAVPDISLTTDIIVGFPGETDEDFELTLGLLQKIEFDGIFAFKYSKRPNTVAVSMPGHIDESLKDDRLSRLFALQKNITLRRNKRHVGTVLEVLVEGKSKRGDMQTGRSRGNKVVNFSGQQMQIGSLVNVRITSAGPNSLTGEVCA